MAVTVVQTAATSSTTNNPTLKYQARPTANNFLLAYCMQENVAMPGIPTDTAGETWEMIACEPKLPDPQFAPDGLSICVYRVPLALGGTTTVAFPTITNSVEAVQEFSGVLADQPPQLGAPEIDQPDYVSAGFAGPQTEFYVGANPQNASAYCQAIVVALDATVTWTVDTTGQFAGWTLDRSFTGGAAGQHLGLSGVLLHRVASSFVLAHVTASKPTVACVIGLSLS